MNSHRTAIPRAAAHKRSQKDRCVTAITKSKKNQWMHKPERAVLSDDRYGSKEGLVQGALAESTETEASLLYSGAQSID